MIPLKEYIERIDFLMRDRYCVSCSDAGVNYDVITSWFEEGGEPEEFVEWFGMKYGLIKRDDYSMNTARSQAILGMIQRVLRALS